MLRFSIALELKFIGDFVNTSADEYHATYGNKQSSCPTNILELPTVASLNI